MSVCYIVGAGEFNTSFNPSEEDLVIAADGGYDALISHGIRCDLLIGDLDSIRDLPRELEIIKHPVEKDETDTFLAYSEGVKRGYRQFEIYGGCGGFEDHTYANLCLLHYASLAGHCARLIEEKTTAFVITNREITLKSTKDKRLSIFAVGGDAVGVSIIGAKYLADGVTLSPAFPLGVSNSFTDLPCTVRVERGSLLVMTEN